MNSNAIGSIDGGLSTVNEASSTVEYAEDVSGNRAPDLSIVTDGAHPGVVVDTVEELGVINPITGGYFV